MSPPPYSEINLAGICLANGTYAFTISGLEPNPTLSPSFDGQGLVSTETGAIGPLSADPRFAAQEQGMTSLFPPETPQDRWEMRRWTVLQDLARPFPPEQYEIRERLIRRLLMEGLHEGNVREIGQQLETLGLVVPRPPRMRPVALAEVPEAPPMPRISPEMEREAVRALGASRPLRTVSESLPEVLETYRFDRTLKIRSAQPLTGSAYSSLDRALIVVDGHPGGVFSVAQMNQSQWDAFRSDGVQRGYAVTNPRNDGSLRTDARTLEYHIIADSIDPATVQYFRENNPYLRLIRYSSVSDIAAGRGEVLIDSPRQYLRSELAQEGTLHEADGFVEVRRGDAVVRRFPSSQVTTEFHHYLGRLRPDRAAEARAVAASRGWDFSRMNREQAAEFLNILQGPEHRWTLEEIHSLIGSEGMRSYYGYGTERPFGFETTESYRAFRMDVLQSLEASGLPVDTGEARVIMSGSAMSGYSSKGGEFRWSETTDALGRVRAPSDYDIKVVVPQDVFERWVQRSLDAQPTERMRKALRKYIAGTDGLRWAELPPSFREALRPLMERYPRIQQVTIALEGGYWHAQDPMADVPRLELTDGLRPAAQAQPVPVIAQPAAPVVRTGWEEVLTHRLNDRAIYESLSRVDRALADYYRTNLSPSVSPVMTVSDLISRTGLLNPQALEGALAAATRDGQSVGQVPERAVFELITRSAEIRGAWRVEDPTMRPQMTLRFETEVRRSERPGVERLDRDPLREAEERRERETTRARRP